MQIINISSKEFLRLTRLPDIPESHLIIAIYFQALSDISRGLKICSDYRKIIDTEKNIDKRSAASIKFMRHWADISASVDFICEDPFGLFDGNDAAWRAVRIAVFSDPDEI